ncbi:hypothetical protein A1F94_001072 [Pyrenophora tritici-repentis]|nr:hypothetical protein A1F94_001072 [Pyrenophora tritici-repentis]
MRQFQNVSISPWANPYSGNTAPSTRRSPYAPVTAPQPQPYQPLLRRPPTVSHSEVVQVADEGGDGGQAESASAPIAAEPSESAPVSDMPAESTPPQEVSPSEESTPAEEPSTSSAEEVAPLKKPLQSKK